MAYLWWFSLGLFGAHHFYLGQNRRGWLYLGTAGLCGLGWLVDPFLLPRQVRGINDVLLALARATDRPYPSQGVAGPTAAGAGFPGTRPGRTLPGAWPSAAAPGSVWRGVRS
ncbi:MAG: TM2 domain-containing protein [Trebonia sp.]